MGIAIHYKGIMDDACQIDNFTNEMLDISKEMGWKYNLINDKEKQLKGIITSPHEKSEGMTFLFDPKGKLHSIVDLISDEIDEEFQGEAFEYAHIKTQFAPLDTHIAVIKLLKYIKSKYIGNLNVIDEGDYWDTMDKAVLKEKMDFLASKIDLIGDILNSGALDLKGSKTPGDIADKLEEVFKKLGFDKG